MSQIYTSILIDAHTCEVVESHWPDTEKVPTVRVSILRGTSPNSAGAMIRAIANMVDPPPVAPSQALAATAVA